MEMEEIKEGLENIFKKLENVLENIASQEMTEHEESLAESSYNIPAEVNENSKIYSRNIDKAGDGEQCIDEDMSRDEEYAIVDGEKKYEDCYTSDCVSDESKGFETSADSILESVSSSSTSASLASVVALEPEISVDEECDFDDLTGENSLSHEEFDFGDSNMADKDSVSAKLSDTNTEHIVYSTAKMKSDENLAQEQNKFISMNLKKEVEDITKKFCERLKNSVFLNPDKPSLEEDKKSLKFGKNNMKTGIIRSSTPEFASNRNINQGVFPVEYSSCSELESTNRKCCCNERYRQSNSSTIEWGGDPYETKENRKYFIKQCKSDKTDYQLHNTDVASSEKIDVNEKNKVKKLKNVNKEICRQNKNNLKLAEVKATESQPLKSNAPSSSKSCMIGDTCFWECVHTKNKKTNLATKTNVAKFQPLKTDAASPETSSMLEKRKRKKHCCKCNKKSNLLVIRNEADMQRNSFAMARAMAMSMAEFQRQRCEKKAAEDRQTVYQFLLVVFGFILIYYYFF